MKHTYYTVPRTDLAYEAVATHEKNDGILFSERSHGRFNVSSMSIISEEAEKKTGKPRGSYHTVFAGQTQNLTDDEREALKDLIASLLSEASGININGNSTLLIAGLGNRSLTADAVGPLVVDKVTVTRELKYSNGELFRKLECACISAVAPGTAAQTGIEAADIIAGAVRTVSPDAVIVVDALAARSCSRLATTLQISDTGIAPGSGIGNTRTPITKETIGVPIISLGIPTVVDSSSLVYDILESSGITHQNVDPDLSRVLNNSRSFYVSPKDIDVTVEDVSSLIAAAIDRLAGF